METLRTRRQAQKHGWGLRSLLGQGAGKQSPHTDKKAPRIHRIS